MQRALLLAELRWKYRIQRPKKMNLAGRTRTALYVERYNRLAADAINEFNTAARAAATTEAEATAAAESRGVSGMKQAALKAAATAAHVDPNQPVGALKTALRDVYASKGYRDALFADIFKPLRAWGGFEQAFDCALGAEIHIPFSLSYIVPGDAYVEKEENSTGRG